MSKREWTNIPNGDSDLEREIRASQLFKAKTLQAKAKALAAKCKRVVASEARKAVENPPVKGGTCSDQGKDCASDSTPLLGDSTTTAPARCRKVQPLHKKQAHWSPKQAAREKASQSFIPSCLIPTLEVSDSDKSTPSESEVNSLVETPDPNLEKEARKGKKRSR